MPDPQPLWEVMYYAALRAPINKEDDFEEAARKTSIPAMLRAIADRVEDIDPPEYTKYCAYSEYPSGYDSGAQAAVYAVAAMLRAEADRAEAGK